MLWEITFTDESFGYVESATLAEALTQVAKQNWNQDSSFITKAEVVNNGFGPETVHGWHSVYGGSSPKYGEASPPLRGMGDKVAELLKLRKIIGRGDARFNKYKKRGGKIKPQS